MSGVKKYKVTYDRPNCIGAGACVVAQEDRWVMNDDDNKANLVGGDKTNNHWELEFTEEELQRFMEAAQVCPVNVIHIVDLETGKELI